MLTLKQPRGLKQACTREENDTLSEFSPFQRTFATTRSLW